MNDSALPPSRFVLPRTPPQVPLDHRNTVTFSDLGVERPFENSGRRVRQHHNLGQDNGHLDYIRRMSSATYTQCSSNGDNCSF